ncbi:cytochrome P450 monooxygenase [Armillaria novae-zelandiae]|uniref:Cytochrome P450 monooxygenase n=1 Tax=Armillaria novae-zelandiae TaxID=153914 RepID=A0AA39PDH6_9AGAR|nr:cytochrome P450 monooxygenase [Armillaria novae-zelandiae]
MSSFIHIAMLHLSLEWSHTDLLTVIITVFVLVVLVHLVPYLVDSHGLRSYPGPLIAKFSDAWLGYMTYKGHRSEIVHDLHMKYGPFVRLAPNHVSVALPDAQNIIYGHGNGALKSSFYEAYRISSSYNMFTTQDRQIHTRKRKIVSHSFSQKNVLEFEPHVRHFVGQLLKQWDRLYDKALKGGTSGQEGEGWIGREGRLWLDCFPWMGYLAFDIIGDLAFGAPFGMVKAAKDIVQVPADQPAVMGSYGQTGGKYVVKEVQAIKGGDYATATIGVIPKWLRLLLKRAPIFKQDKEDFRVIFGMATIGISKRMQVPSDRNDLLSKLQAGRDEQGLPIGQDELTTEAFSFLIAGSDTTSISTCAIIYYLACTPDAQDKLHKELDEHLDSDVATAERVKKLSYLDACINEGLRLHCTVGIGLHRIAADPGMMISGKCFSGGTVVSAPIYTIHRDPTVWGDDVEKYRPERWFECDSAAMSKAFTPFSVGPRACIGRNLAMLELQIIISSILKRFHFVLENPEQILEVKEGMLRKPTGCRVGMKRREVF